MAQKVSESAVIVWLGKYDLSVHNELGSQKRNVSEIILHPDWDYNEVKYDADIAIVVMKTSVEFSDTIQPICLPHQSNDEVSGYGTIVGWGVIKHFDWEERDQKHVDISNKLLIPAISASDCFSAIPEIKEFSSNRSFCGGYINQTKSVCSGDAGGGFFVKSLTGSWEVRGIISAAVSDAFRNCNADAYSIFTNVATFGDWIKNTIVATFKSA